jgi:cysteine-rich repeat protein
MVETITNEEEPARFVGSRTIGELLGLSRLRQGEFGARSAYQMQEPVVLEVRLRALSAATLVLCIALLLVAGCSGNRADSLSTSKLPVAEAGTPDAEPEPEGATDQDEEDAAAGEDDAGAGGALDAAIELLDGGEVVMVPDPACGDGELNEGEACDEGAANSNTAPGACRLNCQTARCGDGVTDADEACDDGALNSNAEPNACREDCALPRCGDGVIDQDEECDTGAARNDTTPGACRLDCSEARCGDGVTDPDEGCDDRNTDERDGCLNNCRSASCGDNVEGPNEECDDGNTTDGDGCQSTCRRPICGDRVVDSGEQCDDGNASSNDGCRADCSTGCTAARDCDDGNFCNGAERCVDGLCQAGPAVALDDRVACTVDTCDEAGNTVTHAPDDGLCSVQPTSCSGGVRTSHENSCSASQGCQGSTTRSDCPDARSTCTPRGDGSIALATFTPACDGANRDCGAPAMTVASCDVPSPTCDARTRVGTVFAATCDPTSESCGSRVAQVNDCSELDAVRCGRGNLFAERDVGRCDARGQCGASTTQQACDRGANECRDGRIFNAAPTCAEGIGCGAPVLTAGPQCRINDAVCGFDARQQETYTTFTPACADASSCLDGGRPVVDVCESAPPTCSSTTGPGVAVTHRGVCDEQRGCTVEDRTQDCRAADQRACSGNALQVRQARCKAGRGCTMDVEATQDCGPPQCGPVTGAAQLICGGCGTDPTTGALGCLQCRACPTGQSCANGPNGAFCRAPTTPVRDGGVIVVPIFDGGILNPGLVVDPSPFVAPGVIANP